MITKTELKAAARKIHTKVLDLNSAAIDLECWQAWKPAVFRTRGNGNSVAVERANKQTRYLYNTVDFDSFAAADDFAIGLLKEFAVEANDALKLLSQKYIARLHAHIIEELAADIAADAQFMSPPPKLGGRKLMLPEARQEAA